MKRLLFAFASLVLAGLPSAWAQPTIPDTPAGRVFSDWLEAFNSGDPTRIADHYERHRPGDPAQAAIGLREMTGGFNILAVDDVSPRRLVARVKERQGKTTALASLTLVAEDHSRVFTFGLRAIPPDGPEPDYGIDADERDAVIAEVSAKLAESYVFPETASKMTENLRQKLEGGEYDSVEYGDVFAKLLTQHLREVSGDKHLGVGFSPVPMPKRPANPEPNPDRDEQRRKAMEAQNCGFHKTERLAGNVGCVKFNMFADPKICGQTVAAAMGFVANSKALILDLRENGGGDPAMVALISSYLFDKPTHLNDLWNRKEDSTHQYWTLPYVPGKRMAEQPVYVLTAKRTFSAAEEFTYNLQQLDRATVVGETTGGGAHPVRGNRVNDRFQVMVPFARAINPISGTNWEGVGVTPDVDVPASEALDKALELASAAPEEKRG